MTLMIRFLIFSRLLWWYDVDGVCCYPPSSHIVTLKSGSEVSIPTFSGRCTWRNHLQKVVKECLAYLIIKSMFVFQKQQQNNEWKSVRRISNPPCLSFNPVEPSLPCSTSWECKPCGRSTKFWRYSLWAAPHIHDSSL